MSLDALSTLAARLRAIPTLGAEIAKEAAPLVLAVAKATAAAGTTPDGEAWAPRKKDGARALPKAAEALSVRVIADMVVLVLSPLKYTVQNKTRHILPEHGLGVVPPAMADAIRVAARTVLSRAP